MRGETPGGHRSVEKYAGWTQECGKIRRADTGVREEMPGGHRRAGGIKNGRPARRIEKIPPAASAGWQIKKIPPAAPYPEQGRYRAAGFSSLIFFVYGRRTFSAKSAVAAVLFPRVRQGKTFV